MDDILKLIKQAKEDAQQQFIKDFTDNAISQWSKAINYTYKELYDESKKMYDSYIDQYYKYKTKSYIRHGESSPGTMRGINLYRGQQIKFSPGLIPSLDIRFSGEDMEEYQYDFPDEVLAMVMRGIRGVPSRGWWETWTGSYTGKWFGFSGTMSNAFNTFDDRFEDMEEYIFFKKLHSIGGFKLRR